MVPRPGESHPEFAHKGQLHLFEQFEGFPRCDSLTSQEESNSGTLFGSGDQGRTALFTLVRWRGMWNNPAVQAGISESPKYRQIYDSLKRAISEGEYSSGDRLPSESELVRVFGASRLTVNRALRELQLSGLIE